MNFELVSKFSPTGDQPQAITQLVDGLMEREEFQTLLGVTGSGKTFTIANVIKQVNRPTLVLSHNKTLAAQLYSEFKQFFPNNAVEYFVSYYDYYQPEAYIPSTGTYIEKDLSINKEIEKLRLNTTSSLLSGRKDIIVVSSVSCIYGIGNPEDFNAGMIEINCGDLISRNHLLQKLVTALYSRTEAEFERGNFRVKGDTVDIYPAYTDIAFRIHFFGDEIEEIESINPENGHIFENISQICIYPANIFVASKDKMQAAISTIQDDMFQQVEHFNQIDLKTEAKRIKERTEFDLEMIKELGYCSGIENYSRYFDGRTEGSRPFCLLDYFPKNFITVIDESHVTLPQVRAMYGGDRSRKETLVENGFRLPAALDNRPLRFDEFEAINNQTIYVSATPSDYEIEKCEGVIIEQLIRPTGLLDPKISIRSSKNQIDDLLEEIRIRIEKNERILVTTLTKRMAEEFTKYLGKFNVKCNYIHSDVPTLERVEIISGLKDGIFDVLIGVNLLREGLDLPKVSLVAIMDADKEGFLRSEKALIQTAGRAARNLNGLVIMYADKITNSMQKAINDNKRKRKIQKSYNIKNNITPTQIGKSAESKLIQKLKLYKTVEFEQTNTNELTIKQLQRLIKNTKTKMEIAAKEFDFVSAKDLRDKLFNFQKILKSKK
ncbi:MAG TPA: excinuclease ABC subunit UvrB [Flavobacteriales bacterium]|jgi:excinuclease ABC subunit B|nr:excinuclease ABC subunit UvrB [Flavobacteriales bacterium]|tara:strand:+ start:1559 stop:3544 length:1986 start_codon:yes stop_codon:yes gene_type:complete